MLLWNIHLQVLVWTDNFFFLFFFFLRRVPGVKWLSHVIRVCLPTDTFFQSSWNDFLFSFWLGWVFVVVRAFCSGRWTVQSQCSGFSSQWLLLLPSMGSRAQASVVVVHRLSYSEACGIILDQGLNLDWQVKSWPLSHWILFICLKVEGEFLFLHPAKYWGGSLSWSLEHSVC